MTERPTQEWLDRELARDGKLRVCRECRVIPAVPLARHGCFGLSVLELGPDAGEFVDVPADAEKVTLLPVEDSDLFLARYDGEL